MVANLSFQLQFRSLRIYICALRHRDLMRNKRKLVDNLWVPLYTSIALGRKDNSFGHTYNITDYRTYNITLMRDFNVSVGKQVDIWPDVLGRHGIGNMNANGRLLLSKCCEHDLLVTKTCFKQNRGNWRHPRSGHRHIIDFIISTKRDLQDVKHIKAIVDVDCWTDHRLVLAKSI